MVMSEAGVCRLRIRARGHGEECTEKEVQAQIR